MRIFRVAYVVSYVFLGSVERSIENGIFDGWFLSIGNFSHGKIYYSAAQEH
jgi:hypothetical protein